MYRGRSLYFVCICNLLYLLFLSSLTPVWPSWEWRSSVPWRASHTWTSAPVGPSLTTVSHTFISKLVLFRGEELKTKLSHCRVKNLTRLVATETQMSTEGLSKFASKSQHKLKLYGSVVDKKQSGRNTAGSSRRKSNKWRKYFHNQIYANSIFDNYSITQSNIK